MKIGDKVRCINDDFPWYMNGCNLPKFGKYYTISNIQISDKDTCRTNKGTVILHFREISNPGVYVLFEDGSHGNEIGFAAHRFRKE